MTTWQERIVGWRFSKSIPHRIAGFLLKASIEGIILFSLPIGAFIAVFTYLLQLPPQSLPAVPQTVVYPRIVAWVVLSVGFWLRLRCVLTDTKSE